MTDNSPVQTKFNSSASLSCLDAYACFNPGASTSVYGNITLLPEFIVVVDVVVEWRSPTVFALSCKQVKNLFFLSIEQFLPSLDVDATAHPENGSTRIPFLNLSRPSASNSVVSVACFSKKLNAVKYSSLSSLSFILATSRIVKRLFFNNLILTSDGNDGYAGIINSAISNVSGLVGGVSAL